MAIKWFHTHSNSVGAYSRCKFYTLVRAKKSKLRDKIGIYILTIDFTGSLMYSLEGKYGIATIQNYIEEEIKWTKFNRSYFCSEKMGPGGSTCLLVIIKIEQNL